MLLEKLKESASDGSQAIDFETIVKQYKRSLFGLIHRMVLNQEDAQDILQEVFVKVWKALPNFKGDAKIFTWLYRIAVNEAITFLRKKKKSLIVSFFSQNEYLMEQVQALPDATPEEQTNKLLQKAIVLLPEKQRVVFELRYFQEMPYAEMSEILKTSQSALKASYHFAVKKIEDYINKNAQ